MESLSPQLISLLIIIASALVYIGLERRFPYDEGQKLFRKGFWTDFVSYSILQSYVLGLIIAALIEWMDTLADSRLYLVADWPLWLQGLFFLVVHDIYIYWFHRWQHVNKYLWRIHEAHHSVEDVDWVAGSRSHALEIMINQTIEFAPIVLLGAAPEIAIFKGTIDAVWGMWIHSNIGVRTGWLQYVINGPEMHRWHHAVDMPWPACNYATKIAIWDWIFGTAHLPKDHGPTGYGLFPGSGYPEDGGWLAHHIAFFRPITEEQLKAQSLAVTKQQEAIAKAAAAESSSVEQPQA